MTSPRGEPGRDGGPPSLPTIRTLPNLRDVGGWPTAAGAQVARGQLYRSVQLGRLDDEGLAAFATLGVRTVVDLRTAGERATEPDRVPDGVDVVDLDVLADAGSAIAAQMGTIAQDPAALSEQLGGRRGAALLEQTYRQFVTLPSARTAYRELFTRLADPGARPALIHCTSGKDRTGWAAAVLLLALGVAHEDVVADYLMTNEQLLPSLAPMIERFVSAGGDAEVLREVLGVRREYLEAALAQMREDYGSVENYLTDGLDLQGSTIESLRRAFLTET